MEPLWNTATLAVPVAPNGLPLNPESVAKLEPARNVIAPMSGEVRSWAWSAIETLPAIEAVAPDPSAIS